MEANKNCMGSQCSLLVRKVALALENHRKLPKSLQITGKNGNKIFQDNPKVIQNYSDIYYK